VTLHSWVIRHDLDGDGAVVKTVDTVGSGYDRCSEHDDIKVDFAIF